MFRSGLKVAAVAAIALVSGTAEAGEKVVRIGGTGMGLGISEELGAAFAQENPDVEVSVLPSMGSTGGMQALADKAIDVGLSGRPLKPKEAANGFTPSLCLVTPLVFATSRSDPNGIDVSELPRLYSSPAPTWKDGTPLKVIMRAHSGSEHPYLADRVSGLKQAFDQAFMRPEIAIGKTDQENARLAERISGSFAIMTLLQIRSEDLKVNVVPINGKRPSARDAAAGSYPFPISVCFIKGPDTPPHALRFLDFLKSDTALRIMENREAVPAG